MVLVVVVVNCIFLGQVQFWDGFVGVEQLCGCVGQGCDVMGGYCGCVGQQLQKVECGVFCGYQCVGMFVQGVDCCICGYCVVIVVLLFDVYFWIELLEVGVELRFFCQYGLFVVGKYCGCMSCSRQQICCGVVCVDVFGEGVCYIKIDQFGGWWGKMFVLVYLCFGVLLVVGWLSWFMMVFMVWLKNVLEVSIWVLLLVSEVVSFCGV